MKKYKTDFIFLITAVAIGAILLLLFLCSPKGDVVRVTIDKSVYGEYPIMKDAIVDINGTNTLVIESGEAYLRDAVCPDKLCVRMGRISRAGQTIICLPNKVVVEIVGEGEEEIDGVAGGVYGTKKN